MNTTTLWLITAILAPTLWAFSNILDAALRKEFIKEDLTLTWLSGLLRFPFVILFFWSGGWEVPTAFSLFMIFVAGVLWILPVILYFKALEHEEASRVALFTQMVPVFTLTIAYFMLGEKLSGFQLLAFLLLICGGTLAALKRVEEKWHLTKAFFVIAVACILWAFSDVLFKKYEMAFSDFHAAFAIYFFSSFLTSIGLYLYSKSKTVKSAPIKNIPKRAWVFLVLSVVAANVGSLSFSYALTLKEASLTTVMLGIQPLMAFALAWFFSKFILEIKKDDLNKESLILKGLSFGLILMGVILLQLK